MLTAPPPLLLLLLAQELLPAPAPLLLPAPPMLLPAPPPPAPLLLLLLPLLLLLLPLLELTPPLALCKLRGAGGCFSSLCCMASNPPREIGSVGGAIMPPALMILSDQL